MKTFGNLTILLNVLKEIVFWGFLIIGNMLLLFGGKFSIKINFSNATAFIEAVKNYFK